MGLFLLLYLYLCLMLQNHVALVTGGSRGIGKGIVEHFAEKGAKVAFTYNNSSEKANAIVAHCKSKFGSEIKAYKSNAAKFDDTEELIKNVLTDFGQLDCLINNAGITQDTLLMRMSEDQWDEVIRINLKSVFNLTKASLRTFLKAKKGSIINMSSVVGINGNAGQANYSASKAGIIGFSKSIAKELGSRNIRCNVIAPGFIETEMTEKLGEEMVESWRNQIPLKRGGLPQDIAQLSAFLASDESSYITGQVISICGGMNM